MKNFKVQFTIWDEYTPKNDWKVVRQNKEEGWTKYEVETNAIDTSDWCRKGSIGVDGYFVHDDFRLAINEDNSDCKLFVNIKDKWIELKPNG